MNDREHSERPHTSNQRLESGDLNWPIRQERGSDPKRKIGKDRPPPSIVDGSASAMRQCVSFQIQGPRYNYFRTLSPEVFPEMAGYDLQKAGLAVRNTILPHESRSVLDDGVRTIHGTTPTLRGVAHRPGRQVRAAANSYFV